jgi:hypothetical protein
MSNHQEKGGEKKKNIPTPQGRRAALLRNAPPSPAPSRVGYEASSSVP